MNFKNIKSDLFSLICRNNYKKVLGRISKQDKMRVIFLVSENSKWGYQSLYEELEKSELFEPLVLVYLLDSVHKGKDKTRMNLEENYEFFKQKGMNVDYAYKNGQYLDLKLFKPDIVFYEQPWGLPNIYRPFNISHFALTCYSSYGFELFDNRNNYKQNFHRLLWTDFVDSNINIKRFENYKEGNSKNCVALGYPKLDIYFDNTNVDSKKYWRNAESFKIIYAPHHSFSEDSIQIATFKENGKKILEFAEQSTNCSWLFKPHPLLKEALLSYNVMNNNEINEYYMRWEKIGTNYNQGNYFDIFKSADLMITDCCSFLCEFLPTMKPIIRPLNPNAIKLNELGQIVANCCYETRNNDELFKQIDYFIQHKEDYKQSNREKALSYLMDSNTKSVVKICQYLQEKIRRK